MSRRTACALLCMAGIPLAYAADPEMGPVDAFDLDRVVVVGRHQAAVGEAVSASEGFVGADEIASRPRLRTGDLLEFVPGLIATTHSGSGKANQYFLRGFNLDHGTDFATFVDGMPVNMRSHGHGQGYTDLGFLMPEVVESIAYRKGNYYADVGDFSSAGAAQFRIADRLEQGRLSVAAGEHGYARVAVADSAKAGRGDLLFAAEAQAYDGPWADIDEQVRKRNLVLRYSGDVAGGRGHVMFMGYRSRWNSADQIPQRAVTSGLVSRFGSLDTGVGGDSTRSSLSAGWRGPIAGGQFDASVYAIDYALDLWSNFTYFLDDPEAGDQFRQTDDRRVYGFSASQQWRTGRHRWRVGIEGRQDDIGRVALSRTVDRRTVGTVRADSIDEGSLGMFVADEVRISDDTRVYFGVRRDRFSFDVHSDRAENSGREQDAITSYKAGLVHRVSAPLELYVNYGTGFHSNDARGATITVDPVSGDPAERVDPLVRSEGFELGARWQRDSRWLATFALWSLDLDSELVFVGDAGNTEAGRPSRRRGVELGMYWTPDARYTVNLEASYTDAFFKGDDPAGNRVPGAIPLVVSSGVSAKWSRGWSASAQLRHFGPYPLVEDNRARADGSTIVNLRAGREWGRWGVDLELLNALDSRDHDIDYFYASRLPGEPEGGIEDVHFHPFPPRSVRLSLNYRF